MLPASIPTVTVSARYLSPDGRPLSGSVEFRPPAMLTHSATDVFVGGPTVARLDAEGRISLALPATDGDGWNPAEWTYTVSERLSGVRNPRTYQVALPAAQTTVDLADLAPADPATPDYVAVPGPPGPQGEPGPQGPAGEPGLVRSVNGVSEPDIVLAPGDLGAVPQASVGAPDGVAGLGPDGVVPVSQLPAGTGEGVSSVNGQTGAVVLTATDVGALDQATGDARYLGIDAAPVKSVNGLTGDVTLTAAEVSAVAAGEAVLLAGDQQVEGAKTFTTPPATTADPAGADQLARRGYVDSVSAAGTWSPSVFGFSGWSFDPATTDATSAQYCINGWLYLIGVPLHAPTTVRNVVFYVAGYAGNGALSSSSYAGLYTSGGTRIGRTASLDTLIPATSGETVVCPLDAPYAAQPGYYWIALLINGPDPRNSGPGFIRGASIGAWPGGSARMPGTFVRHGRLSTTGQTSLPSSFNPSAVEDDSNAIWAALS
ncbi:phage tail protein [Streptomyces sp. JJ36]|uniref:phage tail protein n=1 Tax=Streptomyces sp. JJ36 TaxID=2736645 RepID=UPI001F1A8734|nr:phage tail protein [Streptomyces sp. JJ36]MCF6523059.1 phage tail protein [Streptomyces sp. JJ36]